MKTNIFIVCLIAVLSLGSCKNEAKTDEVAKEAEVKKTTLQLTNLSDENWEGGVGVEYDMFLVDNTKENEELVKTAKELHFTDGTKVKVIGYTVNDPYIQINLEGEASNFKAVAAHPNVIEVK